MLKKAIILIDQVGSSVYNLLVTIIIINSIGIDGFGIYSQYNIAALFVSALINAFISQPMVSIGSKLHDSERNKVVYSSIFGFIILLLIGIIILTFVYLVALYYDLYVNIYLISIFAGSFVASEFIRRLFFLYDAVWSAAIFDISRFGTVIYLLLIKIDYQVVYNWESVIHIISYSFIFYIAMVVILNLRRLTIGWSGVSRNNLYMIAREGSALSMSALFLLMAEYTSAITLSMTGNIKDLGIIRAGQSICGVLNPILYSLEYTIPKILGIWIRDKGAKAAREIYYRVACIAILAIILGMSFFSIILYNYIGVIYGKAFLGHEIVLPVLMIGVFFSFLQNFVYFYIRALGSVYIITISSFLTLVLIVIINAINYSSAGLYFGAMSVVLSKAIPCLFVLIISIFRVRHYTAD